MTKNKKRAKLKYKKKCEYCKEFFIPNHLLQLFCPKCKEDRLNRADKIMLLVRQIK